MTVAVGAFLPIVRGEVQVAASAKLMPPLPFQAGGGWATRDARYEQQPLLPDNIRNFHQAAGVIPFGFGEFVVDVADGLVDLGDDYVFEQQVERSFQRLRVIAPHADHVGEASGRDLAGRVWTRSEASSMTHVSPAAPASKGIGALQAFSPFR
jgi:hypothetical protein